MPFLLSLWVKNLSLLGSTQVGAFDRPKSWRTITQTFLQKKQQHKNNQLA